MDKIKRDLFIGTLNKIDWISLDKYENPFFLELPFNFEDEASWCFEQVFYKNGRLKESALYIVPFLIYGIKHSSLAIREYIYDELFSILSWCSESICSFYQVLTPFKYFSPSITNERSSKLPLKAACRFAVMQELDFFIYDIEYNKNKTAVDLLVMFDEIPCYVVEQLVRIIKHENEGDFQEYISRELAHFKSKMRKI